MLFGHHSPESRLARSDSKDPATTCKGITNSGRPCRRALVGPSTLTASPNRTTDGILAVLDAGDAAAFFCWQHKEQAQLLQTNPQERTKIVPLKKQGSIDTLIERVGVLDINEDEKEDVIVQGGRRYRKQRKSTDGHKSRQKNTFPPEWQNVPGPLMSVPEEVIDITINAEAEKRKRRQEQQSTYISTAATRVGRSNVKSSFTCCIRIVDDDDDDEDHRPTVRRETARPSRPISYRHDLGSSSSPNQNTIQPSLTPTRISRKSVASTTPEMKRTTIMSSPYEYRTAPQTPVTPSRPSLQPRHSSTSPPNSQTMTFLSLIPPHLTPETTSALLAELSRPISDADKDGYIYIFWLTPESELSKPDDSTASSLLDEDNRSMSQEYRSVSGSRYRADEGRTTQALQRYASVRRNTHDPRKILLKIGRTTNVHRRLSEWTKQCGQNITLVRYYPYVNSYSSHTFSSSAERPSVNQKRTVPCVNKVERLIHLELSDKRVTNKGECEVCGKIHKEWFEVSATKQGVQEVDEVIRRWVSWAESKSNPLT